MSQKEADRLHVMKLLFNNDITQKMAADIMVLSKSQTIRRKKAYKNFDSGGGGLEKFKRLRKKHSAIERQFDVT